MADKRIADFAEAASLKDDDLFLISDNTETYNTRFSTIKNSILSENNYTEAEKDKLAGIEQGANKTIVDKDILPNSENPVQNKAVYAALQNMKEGGGMTEDGGFTGGIDAGAVAGAAVGYKSVTGNGFAGGKQAKALGFRNAGNESIVSETGAAVGEEAIAGRGFSGGYRAQVSAQEGSGGSMFIDAVQIGEGVNSEPGTMQVYSHQLLDKNGRIPPDRMINTDGGFTGGAYASATFGAAVGSKAEAGKGFAGGMMAKTVDDSGNKIDAIQLGTGTNSNPKTVQVYEFKLLDENGKIPAERLPESSSGSDNSCAVTTSADGSINIYDYTIFDASGKIPAERLPESSSGSDSSCAITTSEDGSINIYDYKLLDDSGKIPAARMPVASSAASGCIKVGDGVSVDENGVLSSKVQWKDLTNWTTDGLGAGEGYISIPANIYTLFAFITTNGDVLFSSYSTADSSVLTAGSYVFKSASEKGFVNIRLSYDDAIGSYGLDVCEMASLDGGSTTPIRLKALYGIRIQ